MDTTPGMKIDVESQLEPGTHDESLPIITPEMERRVVRKIDKHLMPLIVGLCTYLLEHSRAQWH